MGKIEGSPTAQAAAAQVALPVSPPSPVRSVESQSGSNVPSMDSAYSYIPTRVERRQSIHAKLKGKVIWEQDPVWVRIRKANSAHSDTQSKSDTFSISPQRSAPPPSARYFAARPEILQPPKLQPLIFTGLQTPLTDGADKAAAHDAWWARVSNSLALYSARSYHLSVASSFLTCKSEEILLLYEIRKLNADGMLLFGEVLMVLKARAAAWEGTMDELRISWDMTAKLEIVTRYDGFVAEQVARLEEEVRWETGYYRGRSSHGKYAEEYMPHAPHDERAVENSDSDAEVAPTDTSSNDIYVSAEEGSEKTVSCAEEVDEKHKERALEDPVTNDSIILGSAMKESIIEKPIIERPIIDDTIIKELLTTSLPFNWAEEVNEAFVHQSEQPPKDHNGHEDSTTPQPGLNIDTPPKGHNSPEESTKPQPSIDIDSPPVKALPSPSPARLSAPTWAEVLASGINVKNSSDLKKAKSMDDTAAHAHKHAPPSKNWASDDSAHQVRDVEPVWR